MATISHGSMDPAYTVTNQSLYIRQATCNTDGPYVHQNYESISESWAIGQTTERFQKRLKLGELIPYTAWTKFIRTSTQETNTGYALRDPRSSCYREYSASKIPISLDAARLCFPPDRLWHERGASYHDLRPYVQAAAAKLNSRQFDLLTWAAELKSAAESLKKLLDNSLRAIQRNKLKDMKFDQNTYLEGRYGYAQIVNDMKNLVGAIENYNRKFTRVTERSGTTIKYSETLIHGNGEDIARKNTIVVDDSVTYGLRGMIAADVEPALIQINPLLTAWELLKFSFIVDWVVNVGQAIQAASFVVLHPKYTAASGIRIQVVRTARCLSEPKAPYYYESPYEVLFTGASDYKVRTPQAVSILPHLNPRPLTALQMADLWALISRMKRSL